jgi:uncharacterized protein (DUF1501 family)
MARVAFMYKHDDQLRPLLAQAGMDMGEAGGKNSARGPRQFVSMMKTAAQFMSKPDGARLAAIDLGGWDTHTGQGNGGKDGGQRFQQAAAILDEGLAAYRTGMGAAWQDTAVVVITEFGRTVAQNGSGGSDHGTGSAAFLLGGNVAGGQVLGDWPTLAENKLYEGRDLYPANDLRGLLKGVLAQHLGLSQDIIAQSVFPQSDAAHTLQNLFRV